MEGFDWLCLFDQTGFYLRNVIFFVPGEKNKLQRHTKMWKYVYYHGDKLVSCLQISRAPL